MKRERVEWLLNQLETVVDDDHFYMPNWVSLINPKEENRLDRYTPTVVGDEPLPPCKTAACMAGHIFLTLSPEKQREYQRLHDGEKAGAMYPAVFTGARYELGATYEEAKYLFAPQMTRSVSTITRGDAIAHLRHLLEHSELNWPAIMPAFHFFGDPISVVLD